MAGTRVFLLAALILLSACWACADSTIDSNSFTYQSTSSINANDFHMDIASTSVFKGTPSSSEFPNRSSEGSHADFSGDFMAPGTSHNVKFECTGSSPSPVGYFTKDKVSISGEVHSKALDGTEVSYSPSPLGGTDVVLDIRNQYGSPLSGTCAVYVNTGYASHFNTDDFETLWPGFRIVMPVQPYLFSSGEGFIGIPAHLNSDDEFILIVGTADAGDGAGPLPFAIALSPVEDDLPIGVARRQPDGTVVTVSGIVTCLFYEEGLNKGYIEEEDRSSGICCHSLDPDDVECGDEVKLMQWEISTQKGQRVLNPILSSGFQIVSHDNPIPEPFGMRCRDVGGRALDEFNPGVTNGRGPLNVGLLVYISGLVTATDPAGEWFYVWDGSNMFVPGMGSMPLDDGSGNYGVRVVGHLDCEPWIDWVGVAGVVSTNVDAVLGKVIPEILPYDGPWRVDSFFDVFLAPPDTVLGFPRKNLLSICAAPAGLGTGDPDGLQPYEASQIFAPGRTQEEIHYRLLGWDPIGLGFPMYDQNSEPNGPFGGVVLGDGYWLKPPANWPLSYSGLHSTLSQWIATGPAGKRMIGHPQESDITMEEVFVHSGSEIKTCYDASQYGAGWINSKGIFWDNVGCGFLTVGLPDDNPVEEELKPWRGYWFTFRQDNKAFIIPGKPILKFYQLDFNLDDVVVPNSEWGWVGLTYSGSPNVQYFNLTVNGLWAVQNVPVLSGEGVGVPQTVYMDFNLGVPRGTDVGSLQYTSSLTTSTLGTPPAGTPVSALVASRSIVVDSGIKGEAILGLGPAPTLIGTGAASSATAAGPTNQECEPGECVPTAVSNSLHYLNGQFGLGLTDAQTSIDTMKTATAYDPSPPPGCYSDWPDSKDSYMHNNSYPVNTSTTDNFDQAMGAIGNGYDVELRSETHCAMVTGITKMSNGNYQITVAHDTNQGQGGGTVTETLIYDAAAGVLRGGAGFDGQPPRPTVIEQPG